MGSLASSSRARNQSNNYCVYASFCGSHLAPNTNMSNWIECYNPSTNFWRRVSPIPGLIENHILKGFSMVSVDNSIYVIGGRLCHKVAGKDPDETIEDNLKVLSSVRRYNCHTGTWSKCAPLLISRFDFACTVNENKIYVAGGQCALGSARGISSAEVYDPALDEWNSLPNMSTLRYKCVGVTWQGKIHVVGGFVERSTDGDSPGPYNTDRSSAEVYDPRRGTWDLVARMWDLDVPPNQIVAVEGRLFSSGDCLNVWKGHIEAYNGKLKMWDEVDGSHLNTLSSSPISTSDATSWPPIQRRYLTMAPIGTHLYFLAGYRLAGEISRLRSEVHVFDTSGSGTGWRSFEPVEEEGEKELCCHCCVLIN